MGNIRTTGTSLTIGGFLSLLIGIAAATITYFATPWLWQPLELALSILVGGFVVRALLDNGYQQITVPANYLGVATRLGDKQTGTLYEAGDHWGLPGISGAILVDLRHRRIDLVEKMVASAADTSDIGVDGFVLVHVRAREASKTLNVKDLDESIRELFESRVRLFTVMVSKAENAVQFRDILSDYLELEPRTTAALTPEHREVKARLDGLPPGCVVPGGIDALMEMNTAGEFKRILGLWGVAVEEVEIEEYDIPDVVKEANLKRATQTALMDAEKIRNTARKVMVDELVASGVNPNNAINSVDLLLGLNVKKDVREITITDLDKVAGMMGGHIASLLQQIISRQKP